MADTEQTFVLDRKHRALRSANRWAVQKQLPNGDWDMVASWGGNRRSLIQWCEANDVHPSREAEAALALLPESSGFRDR